MGRHSHPDPMESADATDRFRPSTAKKIRAIISNLKTVKHSVDSYVFQPVCHPLALAIQFVV